MSSEALVGGGTEKEVGLGFPETESGSKSTTPQTEGGKQILRVSLPSTCSRAQSSTLYATAGDAIGKSKG